MIGAGPAGLMAAEQIRRQLPEAVIEIFDAMPSAGRKFLLAGKSGLNLTHAEAAEAFRARYSRGAATVAGWLDDFDAEAVRDWAAGLGIETFVGSSGKIFPEGMKAAPLLRAWLHRLRSSGVVTRMQHRWTGRLEPVGSGWQIGFETPQGARIVSAHAVVLALGGGSWSRLGSDGAWVPWLAQQGVSVAPLEPSNCGFEAGWSSYLIERFAGAPLKGVTLRFSDAEGLPFERLGEAVVTATGLEGNLIYAASARLREAINRQGPLTVTLDLLPARSLDELTAALGRGRGARSLPNHLREVAGLHGVKAALLREGLSAPDWSRLTAANANPALLAARIKAVPVTLLRPRPIDEVISTAGGVRLEALDEQLMLRQLPGVFCAGEMLDWDAPTGGYLLTACLAGGRRAGAGVVEWLTPRVPGQP